MWGREGGISPLSSQPSLYSLAHLPLSAPACLQVREEVAKFIEKRDAGVKSDPNVSEHACLPAYPACKLRCVCCMHVHVYGGVYDDC